jgi:hypothetical protein
MRIITHGPIQELHLAASVAQFFKDHHLMDVVARQAVGRSDKDKVKGGKRRLIAKMIKPWPLEFGAGVAIVAENVLFGETPIGLGGNIGA